MDEKRIYFNNSATTKIDEDVIRIINEELHNFDNPSDLTVQGLTNFDKILESKKTISKILNCLDDEIYFTASGSEGDNMCLKMLAYKQNELYHKKHIIVSQIEHKAILKSAEFLEKQGFEVTYVAPNKNGIIEIESILKAINDKTGLISLMYVNNILGTIQPIYDLCDQIDEYNKIHNTNILVHCDMVQAVGHVPIDLKKHNLAAATFSAHKFHGPRMGFVYINNNVHFDSFICGGGQENGKRAGTENLPYIVGSALALQKTTRNLSVVNSKLQNLKNFLIRQITNNIYNVLIDANHDQTVPNIVHCCFKDISGDALVNILSNKYNISVSAGSACNSGNADPDYVLEAIRVPEEYINGSLRISLCSDNTIQECEYFCKCLIDEIKSMRGTK